MKGYNDYMDTISVDAALHEKIMNHMTQGPAPQKQRRLIYRYAGIAACMVILLLCVLMAGGSGNGDINGVTPYPLYALTLNNVDSQMSASRIFIDGHFWHELTNEQLQALLPDFGFPVSATANYYGDGSLFSIVLYEVSDNGDAAMHNEFFIRTEIQFAPGAIISCAIYDYEPIESYVSGVPVVAGALDFEPNDGVALYIASFKLDGIAYEIKLHDNDTGYDGVNRLTALVNEIIRNGAVDLSVLGDPVIPELRNERLTLNEALIDPDFGAYLPENVPSQFVFESAQRFINQTANSLIASWHTSSPRTNSIRWQISKPTAHDLERIVYASEREKYDMSLYSIPLADSVPAELTEYVFNPVFLAEELTLDIIQARAGLGGRRGDAAGGHMLFSVFYGDVVIEISINGLSPEQVWEMLLRP